MYQTKFFQKLKQDYVDYERGRSQVINQSNKMLRLSKQAIFAIHREDIKQSEDIFAEIEKIIKSLKEKFAKTKRLSYEGAYLAAVEEYIEARLYYAYLQNGKVGDIKEVDYKVEEYLAGLADFTGELKRRAVKLASQRQIKEVEKIKQVIEETVGYFIEYDMRGKLRQKQDEAKNNLRKMEEIVYDLKIRQ